MLDWLKKLMLWPTQEKRACSDHQRALDLLAAIDAGGVPLNAARVNHIGRSLGLEVSRHARVEETVARIRAVMQKAVE